MSVRKHIIWTVLCLATALLMQETVSQTGACVALPRKWQICSRAYLSARFSM